jgi:hypothetical protein
MKNRRGGTMIEDGAAGAIVWPHPGKPSMHPHLSGRFQPRDQPLDLRERILRPDYF